MKLLLPLLVAAAALSAAQASAEPSGESKELPLPGYTDSSREPAKVSGRRAGDKEKSTSRREERAAPPESPSRAEPARPLPGDVPEKTTTPGSLDREGRVNRDEQRTAPPPPPTTPQAEPR